MRLQRAILRELAANLCVAAAVLLFVTALGGTVNAMYRFSDAPLPLLLEGVPFLVVGLLPHLLPMSLLVAIVLTYGRMSAEGEIAAVRSAGVHLGRILSPAFLLAFAISAGNQRLLDEAIPTLHNQRAPYLRRVAQAAIEGWSRGVPDMRWGPFYVKGTPTGEPGVRRQALVVMEEEGLLAEAEEARIEVVGDELVGLLVKPRFFQTGEKREKQSFFRLDPSGDLPGNFRFRLPLDTLSGRSPEIVKERDVSTAELHASLERGRAARPLRARFEIDRRSCLALAPVLFALVGAPVGVFLRRGNRLFAFFVAFVIVLAGYYPLLVMGENLLQSGALPPLAAAGVGDALLLLSGGWLTARLFRM